MIFFITWWRCDFLKMEDASMSCKLNEIYIMVEILGPTLVYKIIFKQGGRKCIMRQTDMSSHNNFASTLCGPKLLVDVL